MKKTPAYMTAFMCLILASQASAISIGAGPSTIDFNKVLRGGYAEEQITVSTSGSEDLTCTVDYTGDMKEWFAVEGGNSFILPANSRVDLKVSMKVPTDAALGRHEGAIYIKSAPTASVMSGAGLIVGAGIKIKVSSDVSEVETVSYRLEGVSVANTETGYPLKFTTTLKNTGNVAIKPEVKIDVYDDLSRTLKKSTTYTAPKDLLPTQSMPLVVEVPSNGLEVGAYTATVNVGDEEQSLTFNLLEKGTLALTGVMKNLALNKIWIETGETAKITGQIENTGQIMIQDAKLTVEVYLIDEEYKTQKLVKVFQGDETLNVPVGETIDLSAYFIPSTPGRYLIEGVVIYGGKKTQPKSTILNVIGRPANYLPYILVTLVLVLGVVYWLTKKGEDGRTRRFRKIWGDYLQLK
jgi:hypothetical protein